MNLSCRVGHWKTTTFVADLRLSGMMATMVLDGPINRDAFQAYVEQVLVRNLRPDDVVIMDKTALEPFSLGNALTRLAAFQRIRRDRRPRQTTSRGAC